MENNNEYYTPELSEMYIGYEYERAVVMGIGREFEADGMYPVDWWEKAVVGIEERDNRDIVTIPHDRFSKYYRTKYLDKSDIEKCGWKNIEELTERDYRGYKATRKRGLYPETLTLIWWSNNKLQISSDLLSSHMYWGECKSINELWKIQRWLEIMPYKQQKDEQNETK